MCNGCVQKEHPDRGTTCLEDGSYLMNYRGCAACHQRDFVMIRNKIPDEDDGVEIITYDHVCKHCDHVIARHEYTFSVTDYYQEYTMLCLLCGNADDVTYALPNDPRLAAF
ncbi:unnamed protein product [Ophioblennius macclurei]